MTLSQTWPRTVVGQGSFASVARVTLGGDTLALKQIQFDALLAVRPHHWLLKSFCSEVTLQVSRRHRPRLATQLTVAAASTVVVFVCRPAQRPVLAAARTRYSHAVHGRRRALRPTLCRRQSGASFAARQRRCGTHLSRRRCSARTQV